MALSELSELGEIKETLESAFSDKKTDEDLSKLQTDTVLHKLGKSIKRFLGFETKEQKEAHDEYKQFQQKLIKENQTSENPYSRKTIATLQFLSNEYLEDMIVEIKKGKNQNKQKEEIKNSKKYQNLCNQFKNSLNISTKNPDEISHLVDSFEEFFFNVQATAPLSDEEIQQQEETINTNTSSELYTHNEEILAQQQTQNPEIIDNKIHKKFSSVKSSPFEKNPKTGVTLCSKTAWQNCYNFGISAPRGNASDSFTKKPFDKNFIKNWKNNSQNNISDFSYYEKNANFADLHISSSSQYGHRAVAFLNTANNKRYVLDPYRNQKKSEPILLSDYQKRGAKILEANFYDSPYKIV